MAEGQRCDAVGIDLGSSGWRVVRATDAGQSEIVSTRLSERSIPPYLECSLGQARTPGFDMVLSVRSFKEGLRNGFAHLYFPEGDPARWLARRLAALHDDVSKALNANHLAACIPLPMTMPEGDRYLIHQAAREAGFRQVSTPDELALLTESAAISLEQGTSLLHLHLGAHASVLLTYTRTAEGLIPSNAHSSAGYSGNKLDELMMLGLINLLTRAYERKSNWELRRFCCEPVRAWCEQAKRELQSVPTVAFRTSDFFPPDDFMPMSIDISQELLKQLHDSAIPQLREAIASSLAAASKPRAMILSGGGAQLAALKEMTREVTAFEPTVLEPQATAWAAARFARRKTLRTLTLLFDNKKLDPQQREFDSWSLEEPLVLSSELSRNEAPADGPSGARQRAPSRDPAGSAGSLRVGLEESMEAAEKKFQNDDVAGAASAMLDVAEETLLSAISLFQGCDRPMPAPAALALGLLEARDTSSLVESLALALRSNSGGTADELAAAAELLEAMVTVSDSSPVIVAQYARVLLQLGERKFRATHRFHVCPSADKSAAHEPKKAVAEFQQVHEIAQKSADLGEEDALQLILRAAAHIAWGQELVEEVSARVQASLDRSRDEP